MEHDYVIQLQALGQLISRAEMNFRIWKIYKTDRARYVDTMNEYLQFFRASIHAHFVAMILPLVMVYETNRQTSNMNRLLKTIPCALFRSEVENFYKESAETSLKKLSLLRNNIFAHKNHENDADFFFDKAKISINEIGKIISSLIDLHNMIAQKYSLNEFNLNCFADRAEKDTHNLLVRLGKN